MQFVEPRRGQLAVTRSNPARSFKVVIEDKAEGPAASLECETMRRLAGNDKKVSGAGRMSPAGYCLHALARKIEDELGMRVPVRPNLRFAVAVKLELSQHEPQRVDFDFSNEDGTPGQHGWEG